MLIPNENINTLNNFEYHNKEKYVSEKENIKKII